MNTQDSEYEVLRPHLTGINKWKWTVWSWKWTVWSEYALVFQYMQIRVFTVCLTIQAVAQDLSYIEEEQSNLY